MKTLTIVFKMAQLPIYPIHHDKYVGDIVGSIKDGFVVYTGGELSVYTKGGFTTYESALEHLRIINIERGFRIRNIVYDMGSHMEMEIDCGGARMKFDHDCLDLVHAHVWRGGPFVETEIDGKNVRFDHLLYHSGRLA